MTDLDIDAVERQPNTIPGHDCHGTDPELAELLTLLAQMGIDHGRTCSDNHGNRGNVRRVWLWLWSSADVMHLLSAISRPEELDDEESLSNRSAGEWEPDEWEEFRENRAWHYAWHPERQDGILTETFHVRFPFTDLAEVVSRLSQHVAGSNKQETITAKVLTAEHFMADILPQLTDMEFETILGLVMLSDAAASKSPLRASDIATVWLQARPRT